MKLVKVPSEYLTEPKWYQQLLRLLAAGWTVIIV